MADTSKIAKNLQAFQMAINAHDRMNPDHTAYGIGLAPFDMERLGFDEGETVLPGTEPIGITLLWLAAALTLWTGWDYMRAGIKHVIDDPR